MIIERIAIIKSFIFNEAIRNHYIIFRLVDVHVGNISWTFTKKQRTGNYAPSTCFRRLFYRAGCSGRFRRCFVWRASRMPSCPHVSFVKTTSSARTKLSKNIFNNQTMLLTVTLPLRAFSNSAKQIGGLNGIRRARESHFSGDSMFRPNFSDGLSFCKLFFSPLDPDPEIPGFFWSRIYCLCIGLNRVPSAGFRTGGSNPPIPRRVASSTRLPLRHQTGKPLDWNQVSISLAKHCVAPLLSIIKNKWSPPQKKLASPPGDAKEIYTLKEI